MRRGPAILFAIVLSFAGCLPARSEARRATDGERLVALLGLEPGDAVAEIGAGDGDLTLQVAGILGSRSRLFTTELKRELPALRRAVAGAPNVTVVEALPDATNLPEACCEAVFMQRVFHHFRRPERNAASLFRTVKPGGRVAVLDFEPKAHWSQPEGTPDRGGHGMPSGDLVRQMTGAGFELVRIEPQWSGDLYTALFRKP
ncbi:MAG TPA: methyltransferase domain-containing protein [Thermoanaerobaculia bacterium]